MYDKICITGNLYNTYIMNKSAKSKLTNIFHVKIYVESRM